MSATDPPAGAPAAVQLPLPRFAVWARRHHVRLPHPVDISQVPGWGVAQPAASPALDLLAEVARSPRVSAFALRAHPDGRTDTVLTFADDSKAVLLALDDSTVRITQIGDDQLAMRVVGALPALDGLPMPVTPIAEPEWNRLSAAVPALSPTAAQERFAEHGLPSRLADAVRAAAAEPVVVGMFGAGAWREGAATTGPRLAAWYEYPAGAVLGERVPPRGAGPAVLQLGPFTPQNAFHVIAAAIRDALGPMTVHR